MAMARLCPHCRRPMTYQRVGVFLPPLKAAIFDIIKRSGDVGITAEELAHDVYCDRRLRPHPRTIKSHCWQINAFYLEETDWIITSEGDSGERRWHLRRRHVRRVVA